MSTFLRNYRSTDDEWDLPFKMGMEHDPGDAFDFEDPPEEGFFLPSGVTILTGDSGSGKTAFATAIALAVAAGEPFAGFSRTIRTKVSWFAAEEDMSDRARLMAHRYSDRDDLLGEKLELKTFYKTSLLDSAANLARFLKCFESWSNLAVLDPMASFVKNTADYRDFVLMLRQVGIDYSIDFLLPHWTSNGGIVGGQGLHSAANAVWRLSHEQRESYRIVSLKMSGRVHPQPRLLRFRSNHPLHYELLPDIPRSLTAEQALRRALCPTPKTAVQLAEETNRPLKTIRNALTRLTANGAATKATAGRNAYIIVNQ